MLGSGTRIAQPVGADRPCQTIVKAAAVATLFEDKIGEGTVKVSEDLILTDECGIARVAELMPVVGPIAVGRKTRNSRVVPLQPIQVKFTNHTGQLIFQEID